MIRAQTLALLLVLLLPAVQAAAQYVQEAPDEPRIRALAATLRCPVCQSESLLESRAPTALEMMAILREQVAEGRSDAEITAYFRNRYGDFVTLAPPPGPIGWAIWALPGLLGLAGLLVWWRGVRRRRSAAAATAGSAPLDLAALERMKP